MKIQELIKSFEPYRVLEGDYKIWLDKNENPFDLPSEVKEEIFEELKKIPLNRYPHITAEPLRERLAEFLGFEKENIIIGNGSDELINLILKLFEGEHIVISSPTFAMYPFYAKLEEVKVVDVPLDENFKLSNVEDYAENARAIFICSPNNPTGNVQEREKVINVLETGIPVILDEAYVEFAKKSNLDLTNEYENLIVLRTFSKAFGLAGARVGYAVANEKIIDYLLRIKVPFSLNVISMKIAELMLDHYDLIKQNINYVIKERERIYREFKDYAYPSEANFLLMHLDAYEFLLERGIVVRKLGGRLDGHIRVTVGKKEENDELIKSLKEFVENVVDI
ncbi:MULTISPECIES: histidinol-phosphate transaminase [Thermococcus]|uniref:Histidinol-phosphate aminotransferase n=1 Tax=Thermococcus sibiricus TaxID=172049 RepID=A0A117L1I3_9EURY|nr:MULTISPECIES: histidinol-phosphate transaminase [Thermococcus]KUK17920.1 MAG: Histidinol-phosphate aminotransferase [Thermococcus sibiricus]KUK29339.1 MAG: Histidinol-phosphate aminotransferase [Thermococcus sp. 40_45]MBC7094643.1 histidinol-phosphate transaminase [Thermococcus sp.]HII67879.1 histidinol-phosphate transaminase [Thermococcaceae archaeon]